MKLEAILKMQYNNISVSLAKLSIETMQVHRPIETIVNLLANNVCPENTARHFSTGRPLQEPQGAIGIIYLSKNLHNDLLQNMGSLGPLRNLTTYSQTSLNAYRCIINQMLLTGTAPYPTQVYEDS